MRSRAALAPDLLRPQLNEKEWDGKRHTLREWFITPQVVIEETIRLTLTGEIIDYTFDTGTNLIRKK